MCTVSFIPHDTGYYLAMNRDEKISRVAGLPPRRHFIDGRAVLFPSEPGGGIWISVNDAGAGFALVNWYAVATHVTGEAVSRGEVVKAMSACVEQGSASVQFDSLPLESINPFRLIGIFRAQRAIGEWQWDLEKLQFKSHRWTARQWISSGFDEPTAQEIRGRTFREAQWQRTSGSLDWLRRLHRSHHPHCGAFSMCVHRSDAKTVSYAEIAVSSRRARMRYQPAAPCEVRTGETWQLELATAEREELFLAGCD